MAKGRRLVNAESRLSPLHPAAPCRVWGLELPAKAEMTEEREGGRAESLLVSLKLLVLLVSMERHPGLGKLEVRHPSARVS